MDRVAREAMIRRLGALVLSLDEPYRAVIVHRFYEDLPPRARSRSAWASPWRRCARASGAVERMRRELDREHRGNRRAWCSVLLPLAGLDVPGVESGVEPAVAGSLAPWLLGGAIETSLGGAWRRPSRAWRSTGARRSGPGEGRFRIGPVPPGRYHLYLIDPRYRTPSLGWISLAFGEERDLGIVRLSPCGSIVAELEGMGVDPLERPRVAVDLR